MIKQSEAEIKEFVTKLWDDGEYKSSFTIKVELFKDGVDLTLSCMYEPPGLSLAKLVSLSEFFDTQSIKDERFSFGGCDTCDYGSDYGFTLEIRE